MSSAVVLSAVRTPVGRYGGALAGVRPDDLAAVAISAAVERAGVAAGEIEDVYFGCANQAGEDNRNVARMAVLLAGLPESVAGVTVNRLCASGLAAVVSACHAVAAGDGDLFVAGGVESMSRAPLALAKPDKAVSARERDRLGHDARLALPQPAARGDVPARVDGRDRRERRRAVGVSREEQDAFALESQRRWAAAAEAGRFDDELVPVGEVTRDEHPRPGHERGAARRAEARVSLRRHGHRGQLVRAQRRRRGARDRFRGKGARARRRAARPLRRLARSRVSTRA